MSFIWVTVILAMSADGKIADESRRAARFTTKTDLTHLESQIAINDAVIFGAGTLRAYGTTLPISNPELLRKRKNENKQEQPLQIVCSRSGNLNPNWRFFSQSIPRGLLTTSLGADKWCQLQTNARLFDHVFIADNRDYKLINWQSFFQQLTKLGHYKIAILGGGNLVASLFAQDLINELWLTVSPSIIGGKNAPTPVDGNSLSPFKSLQLKEVKQVKNELFLNYLVINK